MGNMSKEYQHAYYATHKVTMLALLKEYHKKYLQTEVGKQNKLANAYRMMAKYPEKYKARYILRNAVRLGRIVKDVCEVYGIVEVFMTIVSLWMSGGFATNIILN